MRSKPTLSVATEVPVYPDDMEPLEPEAAHAKLGDSFTVPELGLQIVWVKPGTFTMGSPTSESGRESDETQHPVTLINGFYLGKYEVTQDQWEKVMGSNPSKYRGADRPVEMVSWNDAVAFCKKLTEMEKKAGRVPEGMAYQLPTEAQWEYTCRAGTTTAYSWGDSISAKNASHHRKNPEGTTPVGKYPPNPWAFHDMHGNVWEWCADWYDTYPSGSVTNPEGPASGWDRVLRGGSWYHTGAGLRSAKRRFHRPWQPSRLVGFRVALQEMIHPEHVKAADEAPAGEVPTKGAHEAPAGEAPAERAYEAPAGEVPVEEAYEYHATPKKQKIDQAEAVILPFDVAKANPSKYWQTVNDHLMGGTSTGTSWFTNRDSLNFFGVLRLENGGGFASVRSAGQELELQGATGISIRARGDGRTYWVDLHSPRYMNSFRAALKTQKDGETETYIPLSEFKTQVDGFKAQSAATLFVS